jgi:hypothetical protein
MDELEAQLARLAAHRADAVPPFALTDLDRFGAPRSTRRIVAYAAIAACVVALLIGGGFLSFSGSGDSPTVHSPASPPGLKVAPSTTPLTTIPTTTTPTPTCAPLDGANGASKEGTGTASVPTSLTNVQVETSDCIDEVSFGFAGDAPAWSVSYQPGPLALEPSGQVVGAPNATFYVIRFQPASNSSGLYTGPTDIRPVAPSGVGQVLQLQDFEGVMTWAIGVDAQVPFRVVTRDGVIAVQLAAASQPRETTCTNGAARAQFEVPAGWFVDTTPGDFGCATFAPEPFTIIPNTDGPFPFGTVALQTTSSGPSETENIISSRDTTVGGRAATVTEVEANGAGLFPAGYRSYRYSVDWAPNGVLLLTVGGDPGTAFDARKAGLDAIAASVRSLD